MLILVDELIALHLALLPSSLRPVGEAALGALYHRWYTLARYCKGKGMGNGQLARRQFINGTLFRHCAHWNEKKRKGESERVLTRRESQGLKTSARVSEVS